MKKFKIDFLFIVCVLIPTVFAFVYYAFLASDVYSSESSFIIRSPERQAVSGISLLLKGAGFSRAQDDSYTVDAYINSRDALKQLKLKLPIQQKYAAPEVDFISRFGGLFQDVNFESFYKYYKDKVTVKTDSGTSISTLTVKAFDAQIAYQINENLLKMSEQLINNINNNARRDLITFAEQEVKKAELQANDAALAVVQYRNTNRVFNPEGQSTQVLSQISKLQDQLVQTKMQLAQIQTLAPDNAQIEPLKVQIRVLEQEIAEQKASVTGSSRSLSSKSANFDRLTLEKELADRQLAAAMASLEQARNDAIRKQLYLERISQPNIPDAALEPKRLKNFFSILALGLITWGILRMLVAGAREHKN